MKTNHWKKATHAEFEGTQGPTFGGGFRVRIFAGREQVATSHFPVPESHRNWRDVIRGIDIAHANAKRWAAGFGVA